MRRAFPLTVEMPPSAVPIRYAVTPSEISSLSSDGFVGMVADDPHNKINLKTFHYGIINDHDALKMEEDNYKDVKVTRKLDGKYGTGVIISRLNKTYKILFNLKWSVAD